MCKLECEYRCRVRKQQNKTNSKEPVPSKRHINILPIMSGLITNKSPLLQSYKAGMVVHSSNPNIENWRQEG